MFRSPSLLCLTNVQEPLLIMSDKYSGAPPYYVWQMFRSPSLLCLTNVQEPLLIMSDKCSGALLIMSDKCSGAPPYCVWHMSSMTHLIFGINKTKENKKCCRQIPKWGFVSPQVVATHNLRATEKTDCK